MISRRIPLAAAALVLGLATGSFLFDDRAVVAQSESPDSQKIVVHLSHFTDDLHACFMALKTANLIVGEQREVVLYLDLEGVRLAERRQNLDVTWGKSETTLGELYQRFTDAGGKVLLCPHCAQGARIGDMALRRHAEIASEPALSEMWLQADKSIDY